MNKCEGQEYLTIDEASAEIGWNRATVYDWMKTLGMKKHKFLRNKKTYLHISDVKRLKEIKEKPWTAGEKKSPEEAA
jgi:predicted site-specific integrase-resolvase